MRKAMRTADDDMKVHTKQENAKAWANIKQDFPNVQIKQFPEDIFQAMYDANKKLLKEAAEDSAIAKKIIDSQLSYQEQSRAYTDISERPYLNTMAEVE